MQNQQLDDGSVLRYTGKLPPGALHSFADCLKQATWRDHHEPFAVYYTNPKTHEALLVRDHLGLEPLYYYHHDAKLIVAQNLPDIIKELPQAPSLLNSQIDKLFAHHKTYTDETLYQHIYRVEPGHIMHFKPNGSVLKYPYWQLNEPREQLEYKHQQDYIEHYKSLMDEAVLHNTKNHQSIAAEYSAGLDSSAIYAAANKHGLAPKLYMHIAEPGSKAHDMYVDEYEKKFIEHFGCDDIERIGAEDFDPIEVFDTYGAWYAGPAPYLFTMFASQVHNAVQKGKHPILLSGFGGDQCVSGVMPLNFFMPELIHNKQHQKAWQALGCGNPIKKALQYASYTHPKCYQTSMHLKRSKMRLANALRSKAKYQYPEVHPFQSMYCESTSDAAYQLLQGAHSHEIRMRIEYSAIVGKKLGFEFRYPLLYPKLLEFMASIPSEIKRYDGEGRYLIRQYLAQAIPEDIFASYKKKHGLGIVASTFHHFEKNYLEGNYSAHFKDMPYKHLVTHKAPHIEVRNAIRGYMLKAISS